MRKLTEVMAVVDRIPKNGHNAHFNYDFATESDIADAVRMELAKRFILIVPSAVDSKETAVGDKGMRIFTQKMRFTAMDGESGEELSWDMYGQGSDSLDKGAFKSTTGAVKYAILKLFLIPTGDDPEREEKRQPPPPAGVDGLKEQIRQGQSRQAAPNGHDRNFVMPFANKEKLKLSDVSDKSLEWYRGALSDNIRDPAKARFKEAAQAQLRLIEAEIGHRHSQTEARPDMDRPDFTDMEQPF